MADKTPVKYQGQKLNKFSDQDTIPVKHGGTGVSDFPHKGFLLTDPRKSKDKIEVVKSVYDAVVDPTAREDGRDGFRVSSRWINVANETEWVCVSVTNNVATPNRAIWVQTGQGAGNPPNPDTIRYYASLVDFKYDFQDYTWLDDDGNGTNASGNKVIQIDYQFEGNPVGVMQITYNSDSQPINVKMNYSEVGKPTNNIAMTYDSNGYLDTMQRSIP
jgi:hypothetical protein